jgi:septal ring factor EnvC (AmiA/AmiB activator)
MCCLASYKGTWRKTQVETHNTHKDLKEEKEDTTALKETINQLQGDMEQLEYELSVQEDLIKTKDEQIAKLKKQLDQNNGSA